MSMIEVGNYLNSKKMEVNICEKLKFFLIEKRLNLERMMG